MSDLGLTGFTINREDMLELTRRMTPSRNCFNRIAGVYMDEDGYDTGSFNTHFLKLEGKERDRCLAIAKTIPFSDTNVQLKGYKFPGKKESAGDIHRLLHGLMACELKNDAMLYTLYELIGENYNNGNKEYCVYLYHAAYDVPVKAADKEWLSGSEEVYQFMIVAICPMKGDVPEKPDCGFVYPAFTNRSSDENHILVYQKDISSPHSELFDILSI